MQAEIIDAVLQGHDALALLPTGGGKSLCFQVPAMCRAGICVVVSPLIALMKDQVQNLQKRNIQAVALHAGISSKDIDRILDNCVFGGIKFLYLSPERLTTDIVQERLKRMNVCLLAIDEAHCISQWGYDFRPPYLQIAEIRLLLPASVPVLALTATATAEVISDIQEKLAFRNGQVFRQDFARPNLSYSVLYEDGREQKMLDILKKVPGTSVVYARSRKQCRELAVRIQREGMSADYYHAGLPAEQRSEKQDAWLQGKVRIMVATNAFGMGIDKADVRSVIHYEAPDSLEAYFQEAGRAGRDGQKSYAVLLWSQSEPVRLRRLLAISFPTMTVMRQTYQALCNYFQVAVGPAPTESFDFDISDFTNTYKLELMPTHSSLKMLEQEGWLVLSEAVFMPSTLFFSVPKETVYDYQLRNAAGDKLIKAILRTYEGVFRQPTVIREEPLAKFFKTDLATIQKQLLHIQQSGLGEYRPRKDVPQLTFLGDRVAVSDLTINLQLYNFRKERYEQNVNSVIAYAEQKICRSRQLISYFGEQNATKCGICDVCLGRHRTDIDQDDFARYAQKIAFVLRSGGMSTEELLSAFSPSRKQKVLATITYMLDEGSLLQQKDKLALNVK